MASSQKFIARNRAPRVQIEYDVELYGAEKKIQLPFVMGVMSDLAGKSEVTQPGIADRKFLEIDISYDSDIDLARAIIQEEALRHPLKIDGRTPEQIEAGRPEIPVRVIALGEYYVRLRAYIWAKNNADAFELGCDLLETVKKRFGREGIEIPFPYRTIVQKGLPTNPKPSAGEE